MKKEYEKPIVEVISFEAEESLMDNDFDYDMGTTSDVPDDWE